MTSPEAHVEMADTPRCSVSWSLTRASSANVFSSASCCPSLTARTNAATTSGSSVTVSPSMPKLLSEARRGSPSEDGESMTPPSGGRALIRVKNRESECSPVAARVGAVVETRAEQDERDYRAQFEVNFFGAVALLRLVLPGMRARKRGTIVNVSSMDGIASVPVNGYYSSTKFALEGLTESLWQEIEPLGLRAMLVEPGTFRTGIEQRTKFSGKTIEDYSATSGAFRALVEKVTPDMFPITPALGEPSSRRRPSHALQRDLHEHRLPRAFAEHPLPPKWPRAFARPRSVAAGARGAMVVTPAARGPRVTVRAGPTNRSAAPGIGRCVSRVCKRGDDLYVEDGRDDDRVGALEQRSETRRRARVVRVAGSQRRDGNRRVEHVGAQRRPALSSATASMAVDGGRLRRIPGARAASRADGSATQRHQAAASNAMAPWALLGGPNPAYPAHFPAKTPTRQPSPQSLYAPRRRRRAERGSGTPKAARVFSASTMNASPSR